MILKKNYYFVASVRVYKQNGVELTDSRCWGFYKSLKKAKKAVINNWTDINENGYYPYAVIECFNEGLISINTNFKPIWFKEHYIPHNEYIEFLKDRDPNIQLTIDKEKVSWHDTDGYHTNFDGYRECEQPEFAKGFIGFTIG